MARFLQRLIFWLSYLALPLLVWVCWKIWIEFDSWYWWVLFVLLVVFIYARFVEPYKIKIVHEYFDYGQMTSVKSYLNEEHLKIAIISDKHLGIFKGRKFLRRIVDIVIGLAPDLVLIAGDFINDPGRNELEDLFTELADFKMPVLAVTGNHDARKPGSFVSAQVRAAVEKFGVITLDNGKFSFVKGEYKLNIFGLSDLMEGEMDLSVLDSMSNDLLKGEQNVIMAHNPDVAHYLPNSVPSCLMISGHTHGGQIRLPVIYKLLIPCKFDFDRGWYDVGSHKVFVTSGLGEVILPMRLGVPPEIVLLSIKMR